MRTSYAGKVSAEHLDQTVTANIHQRFAFACRSKVNAAIRFVFEEAFFF